MKLEREVLTVHPGRFSNCYTHTDRRSYFDAGMRTRLQKIPVICIQQEEKLIPHFFIDHSWNLAMPVHAVASHSVRTLGLDPMPIYVVFMVDKEALGQVFSEYLGFPLSMSLNQCSKHVFYSFNVAVNC